LSAWGLFTNDEIAYCQRQRHPAAHYAVRFALKEAIFKALALDDASGASWPGWTSYPAFPSCRFGLRRSHRTRRI
jgi:phosphopantetheinyl transferase (holo-ACP synthase)